MKKRKIFFICTILSLFTQVAYSQITPTSNIYSEMIIDTNFINYDSIINLKDKEIVSFYNKYKSDSIEWNNINNDLKASYISLKQINDTLERLNQDFRTQLNEKNKLLEEKIIILQQKEILFAEKEQLYKDAINTSNVDKVKVEGLIEVKNVSISAKEKEIELLQKSINEKENSIAIKDNNISQITEEKEKYYKMADTLRNRLVETEKELLKINEELKYTRQRAAVAEARIAAATSRRKKIRVIQGLAMRYPTPDWDIIPVASDDGKFSNKIINRNSSAVEFDFLTGASIMLWDLTTSNAKFSSDISIYVGFGGANLFKNFYFGPTYKFLDYLHLTAGVNVAEYQMLAGNWKEGDVLPNGWAIQTTKQWKITPFLSLSFDLELLSYIGKR